MSLIYKKYIIHKWSFNYRNINSILLTFNIIKGGKWGLYRILVDFCADGATICSTNNSGIMIGVKLLIVEPNLPQPHFNPFSHVEKGFFAIFSKLVQARDLKPWSAPHNRLIANILEGLLSSLSKKFAEIWTIEIWPYAWVKKGVKNRGSVKNFLGDFFLV